MAIVEKEREFKFTADDFNILRKISNEHSGIQAPDERFDMFYSRLSKRVRKLGLADFKEYCAYLQSGHDDEFTQFINAITTNLTSFFVNNIILTIYARVWFLSYSYEIKTQNKFVFGQRVALPVKNLIR